MGEWLIRLASQLYGIGELNNKIEMEWWRLAMGKERGVSKGRKRDMSGSERRERGGGC